MPIKLMAHQQRGVEILHNQPRYGLFHDCGSGKTITSLASIQKERDAGFRGKTLVIAPKSILWTAWGGDSRHFPDLKTDICWSKKPSERLEIIQKGDSDVLVTNPETFKAHASDFLRAGVKRLVIDESSKIKAFNTQISKACHKFSDKMNSVYILSGTPAPNDRTEYWSQIRCLDVNVFGDSYYRFCSQYFKPIQITVQGRDRIIGWKAIEGMEEEFFRRLQSCTWSLTKEDCLDLPEQFDIVRPVDLSTAEMRAYYDIKEEARTILASGKQIEANLNAIFIKLRQITGGTIYGDAGVSWVCGESKLDAMEAIIADEIGERQVVHWAEFTAEIDRIRDRLRSMGRKVDVIDGRVDARDRANVVDRFQAGEIDDLVCHPAAAGHGITLTSASYAIYYSHGFSWEQFKQSRDRIHRNGQKNPCTYYHLSAVGTVDERVWKALSEKRDAHDEVMAMLSE